MCFIQRNQHTDPIFTWKLWVTMGHQQCIRCQLSQHVLTKNILRITNIWAKNVQNIRLIDSLGFEQIWLCLANIFSMTWTFPNKHSPSNKIVAHAVYNMIIIGDNNELNMQQHFNILIMIRVIQFWGSNNIFLVLITLTCWK